MLDKKQLVDLFDRLGTPEKGRDVIVRARVEAPVRDVKSSGGNVVTLFASQKMCTEVCAHIATESYRVEFPAAIKHEHDPNVHEYYAQPCKLPFRLVDPATGEIRFIHHTPDYLTICTDGFTLEEWKSEAKLTRLAEKYPYRYARNSDGRWYSPQIEEQLAELGISYRIFSDKDLPTRRTENIMHLADYFHPGALPCDVVDVTRLQSALEECGSLFLADLMAEPYKFTADTLLKAVADRLVVADLDRESLAEPRRSRLYRDATLRDFMAAEKASASIPGQEKFVFDIAEGVCFHFDAQKLTITLVGEKDVICTRTDGTTLTLSRDWLTDAFESGRVVMDEMPGQGNLDLLRYFKSDLEEALRRQEVLRAAGAPLVSNRTVRRWLARQHVASANGANDILALVPRTVARGNRTERLSQAQLDLLQDIIDKKWRTSEATNFKSCYRELLVASDLADIPAPSYPTLIARIKSQQTDQDVRTRQGKRMAYQQSEWVPYLHYDTPIHGSRPFQYVHIDHTELDSELISSRTEKGLGRPWLTVVIDSWSRRILAFYLSYDPPSYRSVMMVIRDMVRRHQRLPEFIVVDNGRDFMSEAFESFLRVMGVHLRFRPAGRPRHGAVMERIFGRIHSEYVHNLAGNTKGTKNVRSLSGSHLPVNFAEWTLEAMYCGLQFWAFEHYNNCRHPVLDFSPNEAHLKGLRDSGSRPQRRVLFNQDFLIATCPPADRGGVRKVNWQHGVKVNDEHYWNPEFRDLRVAGQTIPVRYDPWDASSAYVRLKDRWVHARCRKFVHLGQLTELERRAMTEEFRHRSGDAGDDERALQRLHEFMQVFTPEGALAKSFERQSENKLLYNQLVLSSVNPVAPLSKNSLNEEKQKVPVPVAEIRPSIDPPSNTPNETTAEDPLPDFDTF